MLITMSGRGDKDVALVMERLSMTTPRVRPLELRPARAARREGASSSSPTSPGARLRLGGDARGGGRRGRRRVEVGLPFTDPMMDGPIIQAARCERSPADHAEGIIAELATADVAVPVAVMTYYNIVARTGHRRMARLLADAGILGAIVPDLPLDELDGWGGEADEAGVATVLLAAPTTPG